jgi:hypothetical protein
VRCPACKHTFDVIQPLDDDAEAIMTAEIVPDGQTFELVEFTPAARPVFMPAAPLARYNRRDDYDERDDYDRPRRSGFRCPFCRTHDLPVERMELTTEAWFVFVILLFVCFPLFWIPLLCMKKPCRFCVECGMRLE